MLERQFAANNTDGEDTNDDYLDDNVIMGLNTPIFFIYLSMILYLARKVGI